MLTTRVGSLSGLFPSLCAIANSIPGNDSTLPTRSDGSKDLDTERSYTDTWADLEKLIGTGKTKAIGVSNFGIPFLKNLLSHSKVVPAVNQVENHPRLPQTELVKFCREKGIIVTGYSPFGSTGVPILKEAVIKEVAEKHKVSAGNIVVSWQSEYLDPLRISLF